MSWEPSATLSNLRLRAKLLARVRQFFSERDVLEVETPLLSHYTVTDLHIESFKTATHYLQTSPEYAMKRLLAAGSGSIFQICKAFRHDERGCRHNPEFTLLEWYRTGFNHHDLMNEVDALLQRVLGTAPAQRISYQQLFLNTFALDPLDCDVHALQQCAAQHKLNMTAPITDKDTLLQLLLSHVLEPELGFKAPLFIYDFPAAQAALAQISANDPRVAERFEVYIQGFEVANGFHELTDAQQQRQRFAAQQAQRQKLKRTIPAIDQRLISALAHGLPACAGVAVGLDRLLMILAGTKNIDDIVAFPWQRA